MASQAQASASMSASADRHRGRTIAVTGAAGFIGSHLCEALLAQGAAVVGIDNFDPFYAESVKRANAQQVAASADPSAGSFTLHEIDLCDEGELARVIAGCDTVVHLAAKAGVRPSIADPVGYARANVLGTASVLAASQRVGSARVVCASSSSVYGNCPTAPFAETMSVDEPISPYAATKRANELQCSTHHSLTDTPVACLRFFTVYGPRQRPDLAISKFLHAVSAGETITMFGDGSMSRDFTYVDDIVAGVLASMERIDGHGFRIWNLGSDGPVRVDELIAAVGRTVGREPIVERGPEQPGDVRRTWADLTRSRAELDYAPKTPLERGLAAQYQWLCDEGLGARSTRPH